MLLYGAQPIACSMTMLMLLFQMEKQKFRFGCDFALFEHSFQHNNLTTTWHFHYVLLENHKINAVCFPSFHNTVVAAISHVKCDVCSLWTEYFSENPSLEFLALLLYP